MAFRTLKTIVLQNKKSTFLLRNFVHFIVCLLPSLVNYRPNTTILLSMEDDKGIGVTTYNVFKEFIMTGFDKGFLQKRKLNFDF